MEKHIAGYVRVSSEEQAAHGISVEAQRGILNGWAAMMQAGDIQIYEDAGFSGKNTNRPALQRLLLDVRAGAVSCVVVWKLDRLSRSLRDTLTIIEDILQPRGVSLVSTTESIDTATPSGRMMLNMLASFAQLEREQDSDRVLMAHKHLAEDCKYLGGHVPLGYRVDEEKHFQLDPATAPVVRRVFDMYLARAGYTPILEYLNGAAFGFCRRTTPWKKSDLNYLLHNEIYAGVYVHRLGMDKRTKATRPEVVRVPGGVPAILSADEWEQVSALRAENTHKSALYRARTDYPLRGLVYCAVCGKAMLLRHGGKDRSGVVERYYTCRNGCVRPARMESLEAAVIKSAEALSYQGEAIVRACDVANNYAAGDEADRAADSGPVEKDLFRVRQKMAKITAYIADNGANAPRALMDELRRLEAEETALSSRLELLRRPAGRYDAAAMIAALSACRGMENRPPDERRALIQGAVHAVDVGLDEIRVVLACFLDGGDDSPLYIMHGFPRGRRVCYGGGAVRLTVDFRGGQGA